MPKANALSCMTAILGRAAPLARTAVLLGRLAAPALVVAASSTPSAALAAEPASKKVLAVYVEGNGAGEVRKDIEAILPDRIEVVSQKELAAAMRKAGQTRVGPAIANANQRKKILPRLRKAASLLGVGAMLVGHVSWKVGKRHVHLVWVNEGDEDLPVDGSVELKKSEDERRKAIEAALADTLERFAPAPPPPPKEEDILPPPVEEKKEEEEAPPRERHQAGSSLFAIELGFEASGRWFSYSDGISGNLRSYEVPLAPMASVSAEIYPAATTRVPVLRDVGLTVSYARAFALQSATAGGDPIDTLYQRFSAGLRVRIPFSRPTGPMIGLSGAYLWQTFEVDEPPSLEGQVANVDYKGIRAGVDGRIPAGRVAFLAGFDWLEPFVSTGAVYDRFTGAKVHGIGARGGLSVGLASGFELRLIAEYSRFFADFDPVLGDAFVAGGALDQFFGLRLAGAYVE